MLTSEKLKSALDALTAERAQVIAAGWFLQNCWLTQSKPGGTARTNQKYWQVRSRQPLFDGKTLKHLKADEVEDYKAAIERGRQLKQIDRQIVKLQQQLAQLGSASAATRDSIEPLSTSEKPSLRAVLSQEKRSPEQPKQPITFTDLIEQERLVRETIRKSQALRESLHQATVRNQQLRARATHFLEGQTHRTERFSDS
jgi:hypothetical protein